MSVEIYRETASNAIDSPSQLGDEVSAATVIAIGASIERGVDLAGDADPTKDRIRFFCESAPDEMALDAATAAYPATQPYLPPSLAVVRNDWTDLITFAMREGTARTYDLEIRASIGSGASLKSLSTSSSGSCEYPTGGSLDAEEPYTRGPTNRLRIEAKTSGTVATIRVKSTTTGTITFSTDSSFELGKPLI